MLFFTAKLSIKKVAAIAVICIFATTLILSVSLPQDTVISASGNVISNVKTNEDRIEFLNSIGLEVLENAVEVADVTIPETFSEVYSKYNEVQLQQGFDLAPYAGKTVTRYSYQVTNISEEDGIVIAELLVHKNKIIGGDVHSTYFDGFMRGLYTSAPSNL